MNKDLKALLDDVQEDGIVLDSTPNDRVLIIDGLNLFFRNFAMINAVNPQGVHVGGLGGFLRSLGALVRQTQPTSVYVIFDGVGSSTNRKNLLPEYKSGRDLRRITNWEVFESVDEEHDSKVDQIVRLIQYLKHLPIKVLSMAKVEADDVISHLAQVIDKEYNGRSIIVSSDRDFLQLVNDNIIVYRPIEKSFYTNAMMVEKIGLKAENFILYKVLMGDNSDKIPGVKGLGPKKIYKLFPELQTKHLTLDDIFDIASEKLKENVIYSRIVIGEDDLRKHYSVMNLSTPMLDVNDKILIDKSIKESVPNLDPKLFMDLYNEDSLGGMIRNVDFWLRDNFGPLQQKVDTPE